MQVPKWFELRTATDETPCAFARRIASRAANAVATWPTPSPASTTATAFASTAKRGSVTAFITPDWSRARYQPVRSTPCD
jgi:hypothetical protein